MTATEFKAKCLKLMDRKETVVVTKRGKVVARLVPEVTKREPIFGRWKGMAEEVGDIIHVDTGWTLD